MVINENSTNCHADGNFEGDEHDKLTKKKNFH